LVRPPDPLVDYLRQGRCVLFVGAGISMACGMPSWGTLMRELVAKTPNLADKTRKELDELLEAGRFMDVAEYCRAEMGKSSLGTFIAERFRNSSSTTSENHTIISRLPFVAIVTTNYDRLIEESYIKVNGHLPKTVTHRDLRGTILFDKKFFILKAHGDVDRPDQIVLASSDYRQIIHENPAFNAVMAALLLSNAVLFVGYSLSDPNFRLLLEQQLSIFQDVVPPRYALMPGAGKAESHVLKKNTGIEVLSYPDGAHDKVAEFFRELDRQVAGERVDVTARETTASESAPRAIVGTRLTTQKRRAALLTLAAEGPRFRANVVDHAMVVMGETPLQNLQWAQEAVLKAGQHFHSGETSLAAFGEASHYLAEVLPGNVREHLAALSPQTIVTLQLDASTSATPWEWTEIGGVPLFFRNPTTRSAIAPQTLVLERPTIDSNANVLIIADPTGDLPGARSEGDAIARLYAELLGEGRVQLLVHDKASFSAVADAIRHTSFSVIHFAGHGGMRDSEPFLLLAGKAVVRTRELRALLAEAPPAILFLNSHFTAFTPVRFVGSRTLWEEVLEAGVGAFVGTFGGNMGDDPARRVAVGFHHRLIKGMPVGSAVAEARSEVRAETQATGDLSWAFFSLAGDAELALPAAGEE
jgi:hypothetical protein